MKKIAVISLLTLASCASILDGSEQEVALRVEPNGAAKCTLAGNDYNATVDAPATVKVRRSYKPLLVKCTTPDGKIGDAKVLSDVSGTGYAGAVATLGIGPIVDTATGDAYNYPNDIVVTIGQSKTLGATKMNSNADTNK